jgi:uncharacterized membrane protein
MLRQFREFFRLHWVSGLVFATTLLLLTWIFVERQQAFQRDPGFTFDELLTTIIGVLTSIVVTTFSSVFVALQLASGQFSPRIVRGFFREDWHVQLVLALFVMVISYNLSLKFLGLTRVEDTFELFGKNVNYAAPGIVAGVFLVLVVFPYFIYYIIRNINAAKITRNISDRTINEIEMHFKRKWSFSDPESYDIDLPEDHEGFHLVLANENGYLAHIAPAILKFLKLLGHKVYINKFVGSFIAKGSVIAHVDYLGTSTLRKRLISFIVRRGMKIHDFRSYTQDINFGIRQLVDMAIKAISPAVNDPTTAITCLNYLGEIVREYGQYRIPSSSTEYLERQNIHVNEFDFDKVVDHAFNQIYFWGRVDPIVVRHVIHVITEIIPHIQNPHNLCVLFKEVEDFELLGKSNEALKAAFGLQENVRSLQQNYLCRYLKTGLAAIDRTFTELEGLPEPKRLTCEKLYHKSLGTLRAEKEKMEAYLLQIHAA